LQARPRLPPDYRQKEHAMKHEVISAAPSDASVWVDRLNDQGFCIIPDLVAPDLVRDLAADLAPIFEATPVSVGPFYGDGTKRVGGLLNHSAHAAPFIQHPLILDIMDKVLGPWCDSYQLNLTQAIEILPGSPAQPPHRDQEMWGGEKGLVEYLVNVMWPFTPYTKDNGATLIWPGTHKSSDITEFPEVDPAYGEGDPGSAIVFLGSVQHSGGANTTSFSRRGMIVSYSLGWLKPYELQTLVYPPAIARTFSPALAKLIGYQMHRPNLGSVNGRCPSALLADDRHGGEAIDYLKPEHEMLIRMWRDDLLDVGA
jgi:Phytanoyl-CoA dioxygenase (PhyH)